MVFAVSAVSGVVRDGLREARRARREAAARGCVKEEGLRRYLR